MKKVTKLALLIGIAIVCAVNVSAQERGFGAIGGNLVTGFGDDYTNFGIGAKLQYNMWNPIRVEGAVAAFIRKDHLSMTDMDLNLHYMVFLNDAFCIYPSVGAGLSVWKLWPVEMEIGGFTVKSEGDRATKGYANLGGGMDFWLTDVIILNIEAKYKTIKDASRFNVSVGIAYLF
jgi:outer membrane protein X